MAGNAICTVDQTTVNYVFKRDNATITGSDIKSIQEWKRVVEPPEEEPLHDEETVYNIVDSIEDSDNNYYVITDPASPPICPSGDCDCGCHDGDNCRCDNKPNEPGDVDVDPVEEGKKEPENKNVDRPGYFG